MSHAATSDEFPTASDAPDDDRTPDAAALPQRLLSDRALVLLPGIMGGSPIAPIEVLVQEGLTSLSFPASRIEDLVRVRPLYAARAGFGVHGIGEVDEVHRASDAGATLLLLRAADPELIAAARERGVPVLVPALTPTEVQAAARAGGSGVLVVPADAFGGQYPEQLARLAPDATLVPSGGIGAYSGGRWLDAGAPVVCLDDALVGDAFEGGPLDELRERAQTFRDAIARH